MTFYISYYYTTGMMMMMMMMVIPVPTSLACSLQGAITSSWSFQLIFFGPDMMVPTYPKQWLWIAMKDETWMILSNLLIVIPYGLNYVELENQLFRDSVEWKCCRISHHVWLASWIHEVSSLFPASLHLTWWFSGPVILATLRLVKKADSKLKGGPTSGAEFCNQGSYGNAR